MEKEFVPYELALRLKELGFNEPCFGMYCEGRFHLLYPNSYKDIPEDFYREVDAPTYSQSFKWFREKYEYWCYIKEASKGTCRFYIEKFDEKFFNSDIIDTQEEAELACLKKLIEIVKK